MEDLKKIHYSICEDHEQHQPILQLSCDGILESKSSVSSLDVYSLKFNHCRSIYPIRIIKPCERYKYDEQEQLQQVLNDINENNCVIDCCVFDNLKRAVMKCTKNHAAKFGCEYCYNCAVQFVQCDKKSQKMIKKRYEKQEKHLSKEIKKSKNEKNPEKQTYIQHLIKTLNDLKKEKEKELNKKGRSHLKWPSSTMTGNLRTVDSMKDIINEIENNPDILKNDPDFCKGIKGKSHLLNQPSFDIIKDVPCEYMHLGCLSVVKRMVELNFQVGENRVRNTKRKLTPTELFNKKIKNVQVFRESSRRCRNLDTSVMKALEYRNLVILFFPIVLECIQDEFKNDKRIWLHLVYMMRSCVLPNCEFRKIDTNTVEKACKNFYKLYEKLFGLQNCTYSIHVFPSHLLKIKGNRPLTHKSAFKFESFFSEMRNMFHPGTVSPLKQILQNCYMKRLLEFHYCEKKIFYSTEKKNSKKVHPGKENNSLIYTYDENDILTIYSIVDENNQFSYNCKIQGKFPVKMSLTPEYNWSDVGVFKVGPMSDETYVVNITDISGKVLKVSGYLITCPNNVLLEQ